jgi:hypothetical protein
MTLTKTPELSPRIIEEIERTTDPVLERLRLGRDRIANGWCKGIVFRDGSYCARGAVFPDAANDPALTDQVAVACEAALLAAVPPSYVPHSVWVEMVAYRHVGFNNHPDTTQADVVALFDRAIAKRESEL